MLSYGTERYYIQEHSPISRVIQHLPQPVRKDLSQPYKRVPKDATMLQSSVTKQTRNWANKRPHQRSIQTSCSYQRSSPHKYSQRWVPKILLQNQGYYEGNTRIWLPKIQPKLVKAATKSFPDTLQSTTPKKTSMKWVPKKNQPILPPHLNDHENISKMGEQSVSEVVISNSHSCPRLARIPKSPFSPKLLQLNVLQSTFDRKKSSVSKAVVSHQNTSSMATKTCTDQRTHCENIAPPTQPLTTTNSSSNGSISHLPRSSSPLDFLTSPWNQWTSLFGSAQVTNMLVRIHQNLEISSPSSLKLLLSP